MIWINQAILWLWQAIVMLSHDLTQFGKEYCRDGRKASVRSTGVYCIIKKQISNVLLSVTDY